MVENTNIFYLVLLCVLFIAGVYTLILYCKFWRRGLKAHEVIWSWWHRLLSTFISVLRSVVVAIILYKYQENLLKEKERARYQSLLAMEFSDINKAMSSEGEFAFVISGKKYAAHLTLAPTVIIEEAIRSGLFEPRQTNNLLVLSRTIRMHDLCIQHLLNILACRSFDQDYERAVSTATDWVKYATEKIKLIIQQALNSFNVLFHTL